MAKKEIPVKLLDKRVVDRKLQRGAIDEADFDAYLKALPDLKDRADDIAPLVYGESGDER
jgi:hypothetical protein